MTIEMPSDVVYKYTGAYAVSEAAAKRYLQSDSLLLVKKKSGNVTISVGVIQHKGDYPMAKRLVIAGTGSGVGKTTITIGIMAALKSEVSSFKGLNVDRIISTRRIIRL